MATPTVKIEVIQLDESDLDEISESSAHESKVCELSHTSQPPPIESQDIKAIYAQPSTSARCNKDESSGISYLIDKCQSYHAKLVAYEPVMYGFQLNRWIEHLHNLKETYHRLENRKHINHTAKPQSAWEKERETHPLPPLNDSNSSRLESSSKNSIHRRKPARRPAKRAPKRSPKKVSRKVSRSTVKKISKRGPSIEPSPSTSTSTRQTDAFLRAKQAAKAMKERVAKAKALFQSSVNSGRRPAPGSSKNIDKASTSTFLTRVKTENNYNWKKTEHSTSMRVKTEK